MQHSTSWLNCSKGYRRDILSIAARGPSEAEARADKARRVEAKRRLQLERDQMTRQIDRTPE